MFTYFIISIFLISECFCIYEIPEITLEAYDDGGFRASIPDKQGIQLFAFHANLNKELSQSEPGEYSNELRQPTDNFSWAYENPNLKLKVGDTIYYWVFVQFENLGYKRDNQQWKVTKLVKRGDSCKPSDTIVADKTLVCQNARIFEDDFKTRTIDTRKWIIEQYIPFSDPNYEFNYYTNNPDVCYIFDERILFIKPKPETTLRQKLDFLGSCTRDNTDSCYMEKQAGIVVNPIISGKLVSYFRFRYGIIEIRAKLPAGDWIYPQIYLEQIDDPTRKIWIAYTRGNDQLLSSSNEDIGSRLLFGGPVISYTEPERSKYLRTKRNNVPFTNEMHTYTVRWTKEEITLSVDGLEYGKIDQSTLNRLKLGPDNSNLFRIVLGVGVGGLNDFPDDFKSGTIPKPWINLDPRGMKRFFDKKDTWVNTWRGDNVALQVEYVRITSL